MARRTLKLSQALAGWTPGQPVDGAAIRDYLAAKGITGLALVDPDPAHDALTIEADQDPTAVLTAATIGQSDGDRTRAKVRADFENALSAIQTANTALQAANTVAPSATKAFAAAEAQAWQALLPILRMIVENL